MGDGAAFNYIAMKKAIEDSGLNENDISQIVNHYFDLSLLLHPSLKLLLGVYFYQTY